MFHIPLKLHNHKNTTLDNSHSLKSKVYKYLCVHSGSILKSPDHRGLIAMRVYGKLKEHNVP